VLFAVYFKKFTTVTSGLTDLAELENIRHVDGDNAENDLIAIN